MVSTLVSFGMAISCQALSNVLTQLGYGLGIATGSLPDNWLFNKVATLVGVVGGMALYLRYEGIPLADFWQTMQHYSQACP